MHIGFKMQADRAGAKREETTMSEEMKQLLDDWKSEMSTDPGIALWEKGETPAYNPELDQAEPSIVPFLLPVGKRPRGAVIVCPGGGFRIKAPHEGRPIARWLNNLGIISFVLDYRLVPYTYWDILGDAKRAIRFVRYYAPKWGVDPEKIGILGFSAGGQLTAGAATLFDEGNPNSLDPVESVSSRPNAQVLCYPAISLLEMEHWENASTIIKSFLGPEAGVEDLRRGSAELNIRKDSPPAFLWGTYDDFVFNHWPPYINALKVNGVPFEIHIFSSGPHGMGIAHDHPAASQWPVLCSKWLKELGF